MLMPLASFHVSSWLYQCMTFIIGYIDSRARSSEEHRTPQGNDSLLLPSRYGSFLLTWKLSCASEKEMKGVQFIPVCRLLRLCVYQIPNAI